MSYLSKHRSAIDALALTVTVLAALAAGAVVIAAATHWIAIAALAVAALLLARLGRRLRKRVPRHAILEVDLERGVVEDRPSGIESYLSREALALRDVLDALDRAGTDDRVDALVARLGASGIGLAQAQELRDAVTAFRATGKRAIAYAETLGEGREALADYLVGAAFDEIYLQPGGSVGLVGMMTRAPFLKGVLDRLGVQPRLGHREEYKTAMNLLTETGFTDAHRDSVNAVLDAQYDVVVAGIASDRGLAEPDVKAAIDRGPLRDVEGVSSGLIDGLAYRDEVFDRLKEETGGRPIYLTAYLRKAGRPDRKGTPIALIHATGDVARGASRFSAFPSVGRTMGSDTLASAFRAAVDNRKVKAIVCRVDSRGGSAVASETILREVVRARELGTPVVMTMGNVAASGGYYVAARADKIVAQPTTVTGSIGVVAGKVLTADVWDRIGVTFDHAARGENAGYYSSGLDYTDYGASRLEADLDDVYDRFVGHVAEGRNLEAERARELAKGRVWTGAQAAERGLVDELGGTRTALRLARQEAGLADDAPIKVVTFPKRRRRMPWQHPESSEAAALLAMGVRALDPLAAAWAAVPDGELVLPAGYAQPG